MRQVFGSGVLAVLIMTTAGVAVAQDEVSESASDDETGYLFVVPTYELEGRDVPEAGVSLSWPVDWPLEILDVEGEHELPPEYADEGPVAAWGLLRGESEMGDWCRLWTFEEHPMPLDEHASWEAEWLAASSDDREVEHTLGMVGGELAERVAITLPGSSEVMHIYLFESDGVRFELTCYSPFDDNLAWPDIAGSVRPLDPSPQPEPASSDEPDSQVQRVELTEAGIALTLPADWEVRTEKESVGPAFLPEYISDTDVDVWRVMSAYSTRDEWCDAYMYDGIHLSLDEHATWFEELSAIDALGPPPVATETGSVMLPIGDAASYRQTAEDGDVSTSYLYDMAGNRQYIVCGASFGPDDAWLSIAESIEPLGADAVETPPPEVPADAAFWSIVEDFSTQVPVAEMDRDAWLMSAWCDRAVWIEFPDGTFEERLTCALSDWPVEPPEQQGTRPIETVELRGGECEWASDFWAANDGSEVWASSWSVTVDGGGDVRATSTYAAEELDCQDG